MKKKKGTFFAIIVIITFILQFMDTWYLPISLITDFLTTIFDEFEFMVYLSALFSLVYAIAIILANILEVDER